MSDLIDRQAALDALAKAMPSLTTPDGYGEFDHDIQVTDEAFVDCMRIIQELPSAQPVWIPCSERPPKVREWVLCQCRAGIMDVLRLTEDGYWNKNYPHVEYMSGFVVAWMPLPKLYTGKDGDGNG